MNELKVIAGKDYLFYWVDAIFVRSEKTRDRITEHLKNLSMGYKVIKVDKIHSYGSHVKVFDKSHENNRPFIFEPIKKLDFSKLLNNDF
jgi:hypothetical protein